jgi:predicted DNA-binding transcriptional regulator YafY
VTKARRPVKLNANALLRLALALAEAPREGLTLGQLLVVSGASRASLYRHLDRLRAAGWQIDATHDDDAGREVRYRARLRRGVVPVPGIPE